MVIRVTPGAQRVGRSSFSPISLASRAGRLCGYTGRMIVYCCSDLIFATKVRSTADTLGVVSRPVRDAAMLANRLDRVDDGKANEPVAAVLIDLEAGDHALAMIEQAKVHDPSLPVICFASHVLTDLLLAAREKGADQVLTKGAFTARLPDLLASMKEG